MTMTSQLQTRVKKLTQSPMRTTSSQLQMRMKMTSQLQTRVKKLTQSPMRTTSSQHLMRTKRWTTTPTILKRTSTTGPGLEMSPRTTCSTADSTSETNGTTAITFGLDKTAKSTTSGSESTSQEM